MIEEQYDFYIDDNDRKKADDEELLKWKEQKANLNLVKTKVDIDLKKTSVVHDPVREEREKRNQLDLFEDDCLVVKKISQRYFSYNFNRNSGNSNSMKMRLENELKGIRSQEATTDEVRPSFQSSETLVELLPLRLMAGPKTKVDTVFYYDLCFNDIVIKYYVSTSTGAKWERASFEELELESRDIDDITAELPSRIKKCLAMNSANVMVVKQREMRNPGSPQHGQLTSLSVGKASTVKDRVQAKRKFEEVEEESEDLVDIQLTHVDFEKIKKKIVARMRSYTLNKKVKVSFPYSEHGQAIGEVKESRQEVHSERLLHHRK